MMKHVRVCAVLPMENWLGSSWNQIQGWTTVRQFYSGALEQEPLAMAPFEQSLVLAMPGTTGGVPYIFRLMLEGG